MLSGVLLDLLLGEVPRWHPLVGFGRFANWLESRCNRGGSFVAGLFAWCGAVLPFAVAAYFASRFAEAHMLVVAWIIHAVLLYFCIGLRSLRDHCLPIANALRGADMNRARELTSRIVTRDTSQADEGDLAKAAVESLLENGNDAVFGTLFWFALVGGPGALLFRLANTLDAMWGYRTPRFLVFGCAAARIDDGLNWLPARLTALTYIALGNARTGWQCWHAQARHWPSPNAGPVMAAGAGALQLQLGGVARYDGVDEQRPVLGAGRAARAGDIERAWRLVFSGTLLWCVLIGLAGVIAAFVRWGK